MCEPLMLLQYYVHSPYEIPDVTSTAFTVHSRQERDTTVRFLETVASPQLRRLSVAQRRCVFFDEPVLPVGVYSYNLCKMDCRRRLAIALCGCVPYFYATFPNKDAHTATSGILGGLSEDKKVKSVSTSLSILQIRHTWFGGTSESPCEA